MLRPPNLPPHLLAAPFTIAAARAAGVGPEALRSRALQHPHHAVRSFGLDLGRLVHRCLAYAARMHPGAVFSHTTAAALWQVPLPLAVGGAIHVTVPVGTHAPSGAGIVGHQQRLVFAERREASRLSVASPAAMWAQLAELVSLEDLIAVGEHMVTTNPFEERLPLCEWADLTAAVAVRERGPGHRRRLAALDEMREGAFSRPESFVRLLLVRCGVPEPLINADVVDDAGRFVALPDLQWPEFRVALEYQGDHHRDKNQFRSDIARLERLVDEGWLVVQVSARELYGDPRVIVERVARRLESRGWRGPIHFRRLTSFTP